jgi:hypothetical protein
MPYLYGHPDYPQDGGRTRREGGKRAGTFSKGQPTATPWKVRHSPAPSKLSNYVLSQDGVSASADEVKVKNYPTTKNDRDVRAFLGLASFYRRLVPDFAKLA